MRDAGGAVRRKSMTHLSPAFDIQILLHIVYNKAGVKVYRRMGNRTQYYSPQCLYIGNISYTHCKTANKKIHICRAHFLVFNRQHGSLSQQGNRIVNMFVILNSALKSQIYYQPNIIFLEKPCIQTRYKTLTIPKTCVFCKTGEMTSIQWSQCHHIKPGFCLWIAASLSNTSQVIVEGFRDVIVEWISMNVHEL